jgi:DNA-binding NarL/FixJ family response regulator
MSRLDNSFPLQPPDGLCLDRSRIGKKVLGDKLLMATNGNGMPGNDGGRMAHTGPACELCGPSPQLANGVRAKHQLPARLRVAHVDGDPNAHVLIRQVFSEHASGWTLDSHRSLDSLLAALERQPLAEGLSTNHSPNDQLPVRHAAPDVVLMEVEWPPLSPADSLRRLMARLPDPRIVIFTGRSDHDTVMGSLLAGAAGYLLKPAAPACLIRVVSDAAEGRPVLCGAAQGAVVGYFHRLGAATRCKTLSWREREVMLHALKGTPNKDLATALGIKEGTLHTHWDNIFKKLEVHSKDEARRKFMGVKPCPPGSA